ADRPARPGDLLGGQPTDGPDARGGRGGPRRAADRHRLRVPPAQLHPRHVRGRGEGVSVVDGRWALGLDGGNTKTIAVVGVAGPDGRAEVRGVGRAGCADIYGAPSPAAALEQMEAAVAKALAE